MAQDGIDVSGFEDTIFNEDFLSNSLNDVFGRFGNKIQEDLIKSLESGGHNATLRLQQSIELDVEVFGQTGFKWQLKLADYYTFLDKGVNGTEKNRNSPYSFKSSGQNWEEKKRSLVEWIGVKSVFGGLTFEEREGLAFGIMKKQIRFGMEPTNWFSKVVEDGRLEELIKELSESIGRNIILKDGNN
jgi:hypothetical protein